MENLPTDITSPTVGRSHSAQWNSGPDRELKLELLLRVLAVYGRTEDQGKAAVETKVILIR